VSIFIGMIYNRRIERFGSGGLTLDEIISLKELLPTDDEMAKLDNSGLTSIIDLLKKKEYGDAYLNSVINKEDIDSKKKIVALRSMVNIMMELIKTLGGNIGIEQGKRYSFSDALTRNNATSNENKFIGSVPISISVQSEPVSSFTYLPFTSSPSEFSSAFITATPFPATPFPATPFPTTTTPVPTTTAPASTTTPEPYTSANYQMSNSELKCYAKNKKDLEANGVVSDSQLQYHWTAHGANEKRNNQCSTTAPVPTTATPVPTTTAPVPTTTAPASTATTPVPTTTTPASTTTPEPYTSANYQMSYSELKCYAKNNPDLEANGVVSDSQLQYHWTAHGANEKRNNQCSTPTPAPTTTTPAPTTTTPAPTTTTPAPTTTTPAPTTSAAKIEAEKMVVEKRRILEAEISKAGMMRTNANNALQSLNDATRAVDNATAEYSSNSANANRALSDLRAATDALDNAKKLLADANASQKSMEQSVASKSASVANAKSALDNANYQKGLNDQAFANAQNDYNQTNAIASQSCGRMDMSCKMQKTNAHISLTAKAPGLNSARQNAENANAAANNALNVFNAANSEYEAEVQRKKSVDNDVVTKQREADNATSRFDSTKATYDDAKIKADMSNQKVQSESQKKSQLENTYNQLFQEANKQDNAVKNAEQEYNDAMNKASRILA